MSPFVRIGYCVSCGWFNQQTLHGRTRPRIRCTRCGMPIRGPGVGGLGDCIVDLSIKPMRYSQKKLKEMYLDKDGWIP